MRIRTTTRLAAIILAMIGGAGACSSMGVGHTQDASDDRGSGTGGTGAGTGGITENGGRGGSATGGSATGGSTGGSATGGSATGGSAGLGGVAGTRGGSGGEGGAGGGDQTCRTNGDCRVGKVCYVGASTCSGLTGQCVDKQQQACSGCACLAIVTGSCPVAQGGMCAGTDVATGCWYCALPAGG
jgi:hypothetical protein